MRKLTQLSAAIATIIGAATVASTANAVTTVPAANRVYISGATATDNALKTLFLRKGVTGGAAICRSASTTPTGTIDVYIDGTDVTKNNSTAILCTLNQAIGGLAAGNDVAIIKESEGGSDRGTVAVAQAQSLASFRSLDDLTGCSAGTAVGATTVASFPNHAEFTLHSGCTAKATVTTQIGVADVDPQLFNIGTAPVSTADVKRLTADALYQPMFGVAVSLNLYRALQRAQGKTLDDTSANIPTLTTPQIRYLFQAGGADSWSSIVSSTGKAITDLSYTNNVVVSNTAFVCRRGDESGTQAGTAQYFLDERCALDRGPPLFVGASNADQQNGTVYTRVTDDALRVYAGKGSGDVRNCLDQHSDIDTFAIGLLGSESKYDGINSLGGSAGKNDGTQQFRYIAIDGRKPTLEEVANGHYDFVMENVLNRRKTAFNGVPVIAGPQLGMYNYIKTAFADVDVIRSLLVTQSIGTTGGLMPGLNSAGLGSSTPPVDATLLNSNPVSPYTKSPNVSVNNCDVPVPVGPVSTN